MKNLTVKLTLNERNLILNETFADDDLTDRLKIAEVKNGQITAEYSEDDLEFLIGYVAAEANHARNKSLEKRLDNLFDKLQDIFYSEDDEAGGSDKMQRIVDEFVNQYKTRPMKAFDNLTPDAMTRLLHRPFESDSILRLNRLNSIDFEAIPFLSELKFLAGIVEDEKELKLTQHGYIPPRFVKEVCSKGFTPESILKSSIMKVIKESDSIPVHLARIILDISGTIKTRNNTLSVTKNGLKRLKDDQAFLEHVFQVYVNKFNWAYLDGFGENRIGQMGAGFSLLLVSRYGSKKRPGSFYSDKYFTAFPALLDEIEPFSHKTKEAVASDCYLLRTFIRFLKYFGLIEIEWEKGEKYISKSELFDRFISFDVK